MTARASPLFFFALGVRILLVVIQVMKLSGLEVGVREKVQRAVHLRAAERDYDCPVAAFSRPPHRALRVGYLVLHEARLRERLEVRVDASYF